LGARKVSREPGTPPPLHRVFVGISIFGLSEWCNSAPMSAGSAANRARAASRPGAHALGARPEGPVPRSIGSLSEFPFAHQRPTHTILTVYRVGIESFAFAAIARVRRRPPSDRATARASNCRPRTALTVYRVGIESFAFAAIARVRRRPPSDRATPPDRQPQRRRPHTVLLTVYRVGIESFAFAAIGLSSHRQSSDCATTPD
jgi:hypothetical protein